MADQQQPIVLVVGAASPLGEEICDVLGDMGAFVGICDLSTDACQRIAEKLKQSAYSAESYPADPSKKLAFQTMLEHFLEQHGRIDLLVNATMVDPPDSILAMDEWEWRRALDLNLASVFVASQVIGRVFRDLGAGAILNFVDADALKGSIAYQIAAGGVQALSAASLVEFSKINVLVESHTVEREYNQLKSILHEAVEHLNLPK